MVALLPGELSGRGPRPAIPGEAGGTGGCTGAHLLPLLLVVCCSGVVNRFGAITHFRVHVVS